MREGRLTAVGEWNHVPKRPAGIQVKRWERMCAHARHLLELERAVKGDPHGPSVPRLRAITDADSDVATWSQFPLAHRAVLDEAESRQRFERWLNENPDIFLDRLDAAFRNRATRLNRDDPDAWNRIADGIILGHQRIQFAVGQGGFHAGGLTRIAASLALLESWADQQELAKSDFLYVYDCGSHPQMKVEAEISYLLRRSGSRRLDFLFLSHFDVDHVSGVPALIGDGKLRVDTVVIPYVDDLEKVIAFARAATCSHPVQDFFKDLVVDTVGTLKTLGAGRILLMDNRDGPTPDAPLAGPIGGGPEDLPWKLGPAGEEPPEVRNTGRDSFYVRDGAIEIAGADGEGLQLVWRFLPYVQRAQEDAKIIFAETAEILLGWSAGTFRSRIADPEERRRLVVEQANFLGEAYRHAFGNKNATSLSLYSGPADPSRVGATVVRPRLGRWPLAKIGWLGTGDALLRQSAMVNLFETHFGNLLSAVSTFMLPHHGSIHNSNPKRLVGDADIYFAAAEPGRDDWKHPAQQLVNAAKDADKIFHHVSSRRSSRLEEVAILFCTSSHR